MSTTVIDNAEWAERLRSFKHSAFRLELQPRYLEPEEAETFGRFVDGNPQDPTEVPMLRTWFNQIRSLTDRGRSVERVRVQDDPPTDYQRWERFISPWNVAAGETLRYLDRKRAHEIGLLPAAGPGDFWLFDDTTLMRMFFNDEGRRIRNEISTDQTLVEQAISWRDLAVRNGVLDNPQDTATA